MSSPPTTDDPPISIDVDGADDVHEDAVKFDKVLYGITESIQLLRKLTDENPADLEEQGWTQAHIDLYQVAFLAGKRVVRHENFSEFHADGWAALPDSLREDVAPKLNRVSPTYGIETAVPTRGDTDE